MPKFPVDISSDLSKGTFSPQKTVQQEDVLSQVMSNFNQNFTFDMTGYKSFSITIDNGGQSTNSYFELFGSNDLVQFLILPLKLNTNTGSLIGGGFNANNNTVLNLIANKTTKYVRIYYGNGATLHRINVVRSQSAINETSRALQDSPESYIRYVSAAGGVTASPITLFAAINPAYRSILKAIQFTNNGTATVEVAILDGSAGTAMWRQIIPVNAVLSQTFDIPLRSGAGNLLQLTLTSGAALAVSVNAQGLTTNA